VERADSHVTSHYVYEIKDATIETNVGLERGQAHMSNPVFEFQIISKDPDGTGQFYCELFGWSVNSDSAIRYRQIDTGSSEGIQGGIWPAPPQSTNFVQLFVAVEDVAAVVSKAETIGARLLIAPTKLPEGGEIAVMHDPQGMPFVVCRREGGRGQKQKPGNPAQALLRSAPYFPVGDVEESASYYERVLGFQREYAAGVPPQFAIVSRDGLSIMFRLVSMPEKICPNERQGGTWDAFFWVADVLALHEELRRNGAAIVYGPLIREAYQMQEFAIRDREGYVLGFGQPLASQGTKS
jgi:predicted enzyme related to lactoylglutathione lyase